LLRKYIRDVTMAAMVGNMGSPSSSSTRSRNGTRSSSSSSSSSSSKSICRAQLWVDEFADLDLVTASLQDADIQFLDLYLKRSFLASAGRRDITRLMERIGALPSLARLDISCPCLEGSRDFGGDAEESHPYLPITALQKAFTTTTTATATASSSNGDSSTSTTTSHSKLTHLLLVNLNLSGTHQEFDAFGRHVATHLPLLHCVVLSVSRLQNTEVAAATTTTTSYSLLDPLIRWLAQLPDLLHLIVPAQNYTDGTKSIATTTSNQDSSTCFGTLSPSTLVACIQSSSLKDLSLHHLGLNTLHWQTIRPWLCSRRCVIREMDVQCHLTVAGAREIAKILRHNRTLEELTLRLTKTADTDEQQQEQVYTVLASGVARAKCLTSFQLENANLSTCALRKPFRDMLHDNYSLESVRLNNGCLGHEIAFYMRLNQCGRRHLFQCTHCGQRDETFLQMLEGLSRDRGNKDDSTTSLSYVYYFLSQKPSIMFLGASGGSACNGRHSLKSSSTGAKRGRSWQSGNHLEPAAVSMNKRTRLYRAAKYNSVSYKYK